MSMLLIQTGFASCSSIHGVSVCGIHYVFPQPQMGVYVSGFLWACIFHTSMPRSMLAILDGPRLPKTI